MFSLRTFAMDLLSGNMSHRNEYSIFKNSIIEYYYYYDFYYSTFILPKVKSTILLKSKTKISDPNTEINVHFITHIKWPWDSISTVIHNTIGLICSFLFYQLKYGKYISLSGERTILQSIYITEIPKADPLTVVWMNDIFFRYITFKELKSEFIKLPL